MLKINVKKTKSNLLLFFLLLLSILPIISIGKFKMPVLYLLMPIQLYTLFTILLKKSKVPIIERHIIYIFVFIVVEIFLSSLLGTVNNLGVFIFPTDSIQYIARLLILIFFIDLTFHSKVSTNEFVKYFLFFANIGMIVGILQWIPWYGREFFNKLYPFRDGTLQLSRLNSEIADIRIHGLAQHATSNGGLATLFFSFAFSIFKYYKKYKALAIILMILSIINVFASQARAGLLALITSFLVIYFLDAYISKKKLKITFKLIISLFISAVLFWILYIKGNTIIAKMVYRWTDLIQTKGGGRVQDIKYFIQLLDSLSDFLFGLSKPVVNLSDISYGVEVEAVNIFVTYGAVGFIVQYWLIAILLLYFLKKIRTVSRTSLDSRLSLSLLVASFVGLFSYQVFSIAYFFFREIRVGLFIWIIMGVAIGETEKKNMYYKIKKVIHTNV